jgi:hypothetical protein
MLIATLIANEQGIPMYSKFFAHKDIDESLILAFFSALKSFAKSFVPNSELNHIKIGNVLLDFNIVEFEEIGRLDVLIITEGIDPSSCQALINEISEKFAIFLDSWRSENPNLLIMMEHGQYPDLHGFDSILEQINESCLTIETVQLDIRWAVPIKIIDLIKNMFKLKPALSETYENNETTLLEQVLSEYTAKSLEKDLKQHFLHK